MARITLDWDEVDHTKSHYRLSPSVSLEHMIPQLLLSLGDDAIVLLRRP